MGIRILDIIPTSTGKPMTDLYLSVDSQESISSKNSLKYACLFHISKAAKLAGEAPVKIGNHPLASLQGANREVLSEAVSGFSLDEAVTIKEGYEIFGLLSQVYYSKVEELIVAMEIENGIVINREVV